MWKKWDTLVFVVLKCRQLIQGLINTTSSYCLPFKICANKIDLKSLNVLVLDGMQTSPKLLFLTTFFHYLIFAHVRNYIFNFFCYESISYDFAGIAACLNFWNCQKLQIIDKFRAKSAILYLNTCKSKFFCLNSRLLWKWQIFLGQKALSAFQTLRDVRLEAELFSQMV